MKKQTNIVRLFAQNLKKYRLKRKLTQQVLAESAGIEYKYIQRLEGKKPPAIRIDTLARLAIVLKIRAYQLLQ